MYDFTLCFIVYKDKILMLNREKDPWMGRWNGIGGKIEPDESPLYSVKREILEETGINPYSMRIECKGTLTWNVKDNQRKGLILFVAYPKGSIQLRVPSKTTEGILDLKSLDWILDEDNMGLADNIPYFLPIILSKEECYHFKCTFENNKLIKMSHVQIKDITKILGT